MLFLLSPSGKLFLLSPSEVVHAHASGKLFLLHDFTRRQLEQLDACNLCWAAATVGYPKINWIQFSSLRVAFPTHSRSVWDTTYSRNFLCVVHLNFRKSLTEIEKWAWEDAGGGCNVAVPNLPRREVG